MLAHTILKDISNQVIQKAISSRFNTLNINIQKWIERVKDEFLLSVLNYSSPSQLSHEKSQPSQLPCEKGQPYKDTIFNLIRFSRNCVAHLKKDTNVSYFYFYFLFIF